MCTFKEKCSIIYIEIEERIMQTLTENELKVIRTILQHHLFGAQQKLSQCRHKGTVFKVREKEVEDTLKALSYI